MQNSSYPIARRFRNYTRSINMAKFICQDDGHSVEECAKEFRVSKTTVNKDLKTLYILAFGGYLDPFPDREKKFQMLYTRAKFTLKKVHSRNISKAKTKQKGEQY